MKDHRTVIVIGFGNGFRADDAVGFFAAERIRDMNLPGVTVRCISGDGMSLIEEWTVYDRAILIDGTFSGLAAGTIRRFDALKEDVPVEAFRKHSTHSFGIPEITAMAGELGRHPAEVTVYGIEGADFTPGHNMTGAVRRAALALVARLARGELVPDGETR